MNKYDKAINAIEYETTKMDICLMGVGSEGFKDRCLKEKTELQQAINLLQSKEIASGVVEEKSWGVDIGETSITEVIDEIRKLEGQKIVVFINSNL